MINVPFADSVITMRQFTCLVLVYPDEIVPPIHGNYHENHFVTICGGRYYKIVTTIQRSVDEKVHDADLSEFIDLNSKYMQYLPRLVYQQVHGALSARF
jgi:hypothetical protein